MVTVKTVYSNCMVCLKRLVYQIGIIWEQKPPLEGELLMSQIRVALYHYSNYNKLKPLNLFHAPHVVER